MSLSGGGGGPSISGPVNASGVWLVHFPPQPAAWNRTLTVKDASGASLSVVVSFGEAILCVGQVRIYNTHEQTVLELIVYLFFFLKS